MKFVQITDTHMVPPGLRLWGLDPRARLEACVADINAHHKDAELCVITGDLAHKGQIEAYQAFRECISALKLPCHLMIGNHDDRETFRRAFPAAECDGHGFVQSVVETSAGRFVLTDTHEPGAGWGSYCERRRGWLKQRLDEAGDEPVYLFMHHLPFDVGIPCLDAIGQRDAAGIAELLAPYRNIRYIFFGHVHRPIVGSWQGFPFSALRGTNHQVPFDLETVTPVPKDQAAPAYAVVLLDDVQTVVHFHDYLEDSTLDPHGDPYAPAPARASG